MAYAIAAIAGLLGAASLLLFCVFLWTGPLGLANLGLSERAVLGWNAGLCLLFFVQHSVMVRASFRRWLGKTAPEPFHGLIYTVTSAVALTLLVVLWQPSATQVYAASGLERALMGGVLMLAFAGIVWGMRSLRAFDPFGMEAFLAGAHLEERDLAREFGPEHRLYQRAVPMFVPRMYSLPRHWRATPR